MGDLSEHFSRSEFECRHCGAVRVSCVLLDRLERLRSIVKRPIRVVSGHRCARWNRSVGGAARSRHVIGDAADIEPRIATLTQAEAAGFTGIGTRGPWAVHVDTRPERARWKYD